MSRFLELIVDGTHYKVGVEFGTLDRSFELMEGNGSTTSMSGYSIRDLIGTNTEYSMTIRSLPGQQSDYDALYEVLTSPVDSHMFKLDNNGVIEEFEAQIESGDDEYLGFENGVHHWDNLSVTFKPIVPQELYDDDPLTPDIPTEDDSSQTMNGITLTTVRQSGSSSIYHIANGIATGSAMFFFNFSQIALPTARYVVKCCPAGGSQSTYSVTFRVGSKSYIDYGDGVIFDYNGQDSIIYTINFAVGVEVVDLRFEIDKVSRAIDANLVYSVNQITDEYSGITITRLSDWSGWHVSGVAAANTDISLPITYGTESFPYGKYYFGCFPSNSSASASTYYGVVNYIGGPSYEYGEGVIFEAEQLNLEYTFSLHIAENKSIDIDVKPVFNKLIDSSQGEEVQVKNGVTVYKYYNVTSDTPQFSIYGTATADTEFIFDYNNYFMTAGNYIYTGVMYMGERKIYSSIIVGNEEYFISRYLPIDGQYYDDCYKFYYDGSSKIQCKIYILEGFSYTQESPGYGSLNIYKIDESKNYITLFKTVSETINETTITKTNDDQYVVNTENDIHEQAILPIDVNFASNLYTVSLNRLFCLTGCPKTIGENYSYQLDWLYDGSGVWMDIGYSHIIQANNSDITKYGIRFVVHRDKIARNLTIAPKLYLVALTHTGTHVKNGLTYSVIRRSNGLDGVIVNGIATQDTDLNTYVIGLELDQSSFEAGYYFFKASPSTASENTYYTDFTTTYSRSCEDYDGQGAIIKSDGQVSNAHFAWGVIIKSGVRLDNVMFLPQIDKIDLSLNMFFYCYAIDNDSGTFTASIENFNTIVISGSRSETYAETYGRNPIQFGNATAVTDTIGDLKSQIEHNKCYLVYSGIDDDDNFVVGFPVVGGIIVNKTGQLYPRIQMNSLPIWFYMYIMQGAEANSMIVAPKVLEAPYLEQNGMRIWYGEFQDRHVFYLTGSTTAKTMFSFDCNYIPKEEGRYFFKCCPKKADTIHTDDLRASMDTYYVELHVGAKVYYDIGDPIEFDYNGIDPISVSIVINQGITILQPNASYYGGTPIDSGRFETYCYKIEHLDNYISEIDLGLSVAVVHGYTYIRRLGASSFKLTSISNDYSLGFTCKDMPAGYYVIHSGVDINNASFSDNVAYTLRVEYNNGSTNTWVDLLYDSGPIYIAENGISGIEPYVATSTHSSIRCKNLFYDIYIEKVNDPNE